MYIYICICVYTRNSIYFSFSLSIHIHIPPTVCPARRGPRTAASTAGRGCAVIIMISCKYNKV